MDNFFELLPFLFFLFAAFMKGKKRKTASQGQEKKSTLQRREKKTVPYGLPKLEEWKRMGEQLSEVLKKEIHTAMGDVLNQRLEGLDKNSQQDNKNIIEQQAVKAIEEFSPHNITGGSEVKENYRDVVRENEIGTKGMTFNREEVLRGVIMAEVLGKPKALQK